MAQVKKAHVRDKLLNAAYELFREKGYGRCSMAAIARAGRTSVANIYVYFPSKLHLFYEVYAPIITARMMRLGNTARKIRDPRERLRFIFLTLWRDMPREDSGFSRSLMEAIVTAPPEVEKPHGLLKWNVDFVQKLVVDCLPRERRLAFADSTMAYLAWMAFDGFAINVGRGENCDFESIVTHFSAMLLGERIPAAAGMS